MLSPTLSRREVTPLSNQEHPTSIRLPKDLRHYLQKHASKHGTSLSWLINHVLKQWREWNEQKHDKG